jgi:hypothetical protein
MLLIIFIAADLCAATPNPYPNELKGMKFYERYLAPLRPGQSDTKQIIQVLGSDQGRDLKDWKIGVYFSCTEDFTTCSHGPRNDPLGFIEITPKRRVSLQHFIFSTAFSHSYGGVSEINVTCDVYTDNSGLEYWVLSGNFPSYRKGDLLMIRYGPGHADENISRDK